jgi:hypothetical protein
MYARKKFLCERIRKNNGIVEIFFAKRDGAQEEIVIVNLLTSPDDRYDEDKEYWITIDPAFPH